jgi:hypothetical protein
MSKICPNCKREIDENVKFCPFCASFTGGTPQEKKKSPVGAIIGGAVGILMLGAASLAVFVFDVFGMYGDKAETFYGTGNKLFIQSVTPVCIDGKWGYADKDGQTTLKPQYTAAYAFNEDTNDVAPVAVGGKFGYIKKDGEFVAQPQYSFAGSFSDKGLAKIVDENGNVGFVDSRGRKAFDGQMFDYASDMNDSGYAFAYNLLMPEITTGTESGNYNEIIYSLLSSDGKVTELANGTGISAVYDDKYIGFRQAQSKDETTLDFTREYAVFSADGTQLTDYYDRIVKSGKLLIVCDGTDNESGLYKAKLLKADTLEQVGGEYLCDADIKSYDSGAVLLKRDDKGFIREVLLDDNDNEIFMSYDGSHIVSGFDMSGYACVYEKGKYCGYAASGKQFESNYQFGSFNCGLAPFYDNAKIGYINTNGEKVTDAKFDGASGYYADGYAYVKSGTEYSVIDMSGNTVIGRLSYASDKLMFADTVHSWYDPDDFEGFDGENMFIGEYYFADLVSNIESNKTYDDIYSDMTLVTKDKKIPGGTYRKLNKDYYIDDGYFLVYNISGQNRRIITPDSDCSEYDEIKDKITNASVIDTDGARLVRYSGENNTMAEDIFCNRYILGGTSKKATMSQYTACNLTGTEWQNQIMIYDNRLDPVLTVSSCENFGVSEYGDMLYVSSYKSEMQTDRKIKYYVLTDKNNGHVFMSDNKALTMVGNDFYSVKSSGILSDYYTAYGKKIGKFIYARAYGDRLMCFDYDKYYIYDKYGQLLAEYENKPKISENSGSVVARNADESFTCYDRDFNVILKTKYDIQPLENGYMAYCDAQNGKIGFIDEKGDVAVEAKHEFVSAMSPDGYFVTKIRRDFDEIYSEVYARGLIDVMIYDRNGNAATENMGGMYNAGNSATDGYAPLDFYAGAKYYENTLDIRDNIQYYIAVDRSGKEDRYIDIYGNYHYEEYAVSDIGDSYMCASTIGDTSATLSVLMYDETGRNSRSVSYYLNLDGTPFIKGDRTLTRLSGFIAGENADGNYNIYGERAKVLLSNIKIEKSKYTDYWQNEIYIEKAGNSMYLSDENGARVFDLTTQKLLFEDPYRDVYLIAGNLIRYIINDEYTNETVYRNLDNGKEYHTNMYSIDFIGIDYEKPQERIEFPLKYVKCGEIVYGGATAYETGYDSISVYQIDANMEESLAHTYTAGEGECIFDLYGERVTEVYGLRSNYDEENETATWTVFNVKNDKSVTVDNVIEIERLRENKMSISAWNAEHEIVRYHLGTDDMVLTEEDSGEQ